MNKLIFNYKFHVETIVDGRTIEGLLDVGFRTFMHRRFNLSGFTLPDPRKARGGGREKVLRTWEHAQLALESILLYRPHEAAQDHGRTIIVAPRSPDKYGRCLVNAYVACNNEHFDCPHLTIRRAGYVFLNVVHFMQHLGERKFDLQVGRDILDVCSPYDFDK